MLCSAWTTDPGASNASREVPSMRVEKKQTLQVSFRALHVVAPKGLKAHTDLRLLSFSLPCFLRPTSRNAGTTDQPVIHRPGDSPCQDLAVLPFSPPLNRKSRKRHPPARAPPHDVDATRARSSNTARRPSREGIIKKQGPEEGSPRSAAEEEAKEAQK